MANYDSIKKKTDAQAKVKIEQSNQIYDNQYAATEKIYNQQIEDSNASYAKLYDRANVQRIVNERYAKEMAANMGLSNSGYNRTQQTQIMLAYGNAVLETDYQKTAAANSIRSQLASIKADIETRKAQSAFDIQDAYDRQAVDTYNQQVAAEQAAAAARESALQSAARQQQKDYDSLKEKLVSSDYTDKQKALEINSYCTTYGVGPSEFLDYIGMSESSYDAFTGVLTTSGYSEGSGFPRIDYLLNHKYINDPGTVVPGRNGFIVLYKNGYSRPATDAEIKAGKGLSGDNSSKSSKKEKSNVQSTTWDYSKYSFK